MLEASEILNASVLIVDDQEANVDLLEQVLRNAGYTRITSTMDPRQVCALHAEHRYDLILLDLQMPDMDGFEVMEGLKAIETDGYLPVLVITAQPGHKLRALQAGAKDFVSKPFELVEVQTRIHNMLEVRLLYQKLNDYNQLLERTVQQRTAQLCASEARFQRFTELSSDWYWEQDAHGKLTQFSGPVFEMLGIGASATPGAAVAEAGRWNAGERALLDANIAARRPFLDFVYSRSNLDASVQYLQVSGEPMFDSSSRFIGYRGIGMDITERMLPNQAQLRFRGAMDAIDQGILLIDHASMRVIDANLAACRMFAYSQRELFAIDIAELGIGAQLSAIVTPLTAGRVDNAKNATLHRKDGSTLAVVIDWSAFQMNGNWTIAGIINGAG